MSPTTIESRKGVESSIRSAPVIGVVRASSESEAERQANALIDGGLELVEITFTCPNATVLVERLLAQRADSADTRPLWIGMGTVTSPGRAQEALAAGAEFLVTPNARAETAAVAVEAGAYLVVGALTPTEISAARDMGADLVKVYPLPPVGGAAYLSTVRQPLQDIPMLAAGGFPPEEIPAYRAAGASAYGIGAPLFGSTAEEMGRRIGNALRLARGDDN